MTESLGLVLIAVLGAAAQWFSWRMKIPAILLLLLGGVLVGPIFHLLDPDALLGNLLLPVVSLSVALILFEGGLSLELHEVKKIRGTIISLVSVGALISWLVTAVGGHYILNMNWGLAFLLGAILTVTGPTVIGPLLRQIRPRGPTSALLKWEGIVIDPVGAMLALLVFNVLIAQTRSDAVWAIAQAVGMTIIVGGVGGFILARALHHALRRHWIPEFLQNPFMLAAVVGAFVISNLVQDESGLLTVTVMGAVLANQKTVVLRHIIEFKENLRVLLISSIFILLAARVNLDALLDLGWRAGAFLAVLVVIGRPLSIMISTWRSKEISWRDRAFLSWMAPRGVVAAAVSSVFALELHHEGVAGADLLVSVSFATIVGTVTLYGLTANFLAKKLDVAGGDENGLLVVGAQGWVREFAKVVQAQGVAVQLVDSNRQRIQEARLAGIPAFCGDVLSEVALEELNLSGLGAMLAMTPSQEVNRLSALHFGEVFGRSNTFRLSTMTLKEQNDEVAVQGAYGRILFGKDMGQSYIAGRIASGATFRATTLSAEYGFEEFNKQHGGLARPILLIRGRGVRIGTVDAPLAPIAGDILVNLADYPGLKT
ncbi:MAG: NhaP-type Na+/H+ or K+/H+ antiporter [Planctomycetota bacterium]